MTKKCIKCHIEKDKSCFSIRSDNSKLRNECKDCISLLKKNFKLANKAKYSKLSKEWYHENKSHVLAKVSNYVKNNRLKVLENKRQYYKNNENTVFAKMLLKKFNLSIDAYNDMLLKQNNCCAICLQPETSLNNKKTKICRLAVDHCHKTGKIRQLLCANCNKTLGLVKEDINILQKMIEYVRNHE